MSTAASIDPDSDRDVVAGALLAIRGADDLDRLAAHSGGGHPTEATVVGGLAMTRDRFDHLRSEAERLVAAHHDQHPLRPGMPLATLATGLGSTPELAGRLVEESDILRRVGPDVTSTGHDETLDPDAEAAWDEARAALRGGLAVPDADDLGLGRELLHRMVREGRLIRVSEHLAYLPEQVEEIKGHLSAVSSPFTVAQFRDQSGLSRKYAVPILEWADREGLTIRRGDLRHLR
jgi:selenocysteine-specific elongation factor